MLGIRQVIFLCTSIVLCATSAQATIIFVPIFDPPTTAGPNVTSTRSGTGTWHLYAVDNTDDNFGISSYNIVFNPAITAFNHRTPVGNAVDGNADPQSAGFSGLRSGTNVNPLVASQGLPGTTPFLINGFGQTAGTLAGAVAAIDPAATVFPTSSASWGTYTEPLLEVFSILAPGKKWLFIAEGAYTGSFETVTSNFIVSTVATVYSNGITHTSVAAQTQVVYIIPEPTMLALLGIAAPAALAFRRSRHVVQS